jgi:DNA-binding CsgD family transcriptional regulator
MRAVVAEMQSTELTPAELRVLQGLADGDSRKTIGERLQISGSTIATHIFNACQKLQAGSAEQAVIICFRAGLIGADYDEFSVLSDAATSAKLALTATLAELIPLVREHRKLSAAQHSYLEAIDDLLHAREDDAYSVARDAAGLALQMLADDQQLVFHDGRRAGDLVELLDQSVETARPQRSDGNRHTLRANAG